MSKSIISSPVSDLLPLGQQLSGPQPDRQVEPITEVVDNALILQQQGHSINAGDIMDTDHLERVQIIIKHAAEQHFYI